MTRIRAALCLPLVLAIVGGLATADVSARYKTIEIEQVPIDRLIPNMLRARQRDTSGIQALLNLARLHAMVFSLHADSVPMAKLDTTKVWFGYQPAFVPFNHLTATTSGNDSAIARQHLDLAIALYDTASRMAPGDPVIRLGYAWLLTQTNRRADAVPLLRSVVNQAWTSDQHLTYLFGPTLTIEAAEYLVPLLDPLRDRDEIDTLNARVARLNLAPRMVTPIAIPLADGLAVTDIEDRSAGVTFDADGSGLPKAWTWINANAAWLVHDPRHSGRVNSALQLFGNVTFWLFWRTGYDALASLDDDGDGVLQGSELDGLALWRDANGNGVSDPGEVKPLAAYHIASLSTRFARDARHPDRIAWSSNGVTFTNGRTRPTFDLILHAVQ